MEKSDSLRLVSEVNGYLDSIDEQGNLDMGRLAQLEAYKAEMLARGFNAPFLAMLAQTRAEMDEENAEDAQDRASQTKRLRYIASLKKFTLNRLRVSVASHKLTEALAASGQGAVAKDLPLGGSYLKSMTQAGEMAVEGYHSLMSLFLPKRFNLSGASALIKTVAGEREEEKELDLGESENPGQALRELLGKNTGVAQIAIAQKPRGLIKNHSTRVALFTAAAIAAEREARKTLREEEGADARVRAYNDLLRKNGIVADTPIQALEGMDALQAAALAGGYAQRLHGELLMEEQLEVSLHKRRARYRHLCIERAGETVFRLLVWYYVCLHAEGRKSYGAMPAVLAEPDERMLHVLHEIQREGDPLQHPDRLVGRKMALESRAPPLPSRVWGPAFIAIQCGQDAAWAARYFAADETAIAQAMPLVQSLLAKPEGRGAKFLDGLRKK